MTLTELRKRAPKVRRSCEGHTEDLDDFVPTLKYTRNRATSTSVRAVARESGGRLPAHSERALIARMVRELRPVVSTFDASPPRTCPNVFLTPPTTTDPSPPWAVVRAPRLAAKPRTASTKRRRSALPFITLAVAVAIGAGLVRDDSARAKVALELRRAASEAAALVVSMAIR